MKTFILLLIFLPGFFSLSQKMDSDYFEDGISFYKEGNYEDATKSFQYIIDHFSRSKYYENAVYNLGLSQMFAKKHSDALKTFQFILQSSMNDSDYLGGDIMTNPFANYKHNSASNIFSVYNNLEKYDSALVYLSYADTLYPLQADCGSQAVEYARYQAVNYAELYHKLGDKSQAISKIIPVVWDRFYEDTQMIAVLKGYLQDEKHVFIAFKKALNSIALKGNSRKCDWILSFHGSSLSVPSCFKSRGACSKKKIKKAIKKSELYRMLESL